MELFWPSDLRPQEAKLLRQACKYGAKGVATLVGHHDIVSIKELRDGLIFPLPHHFRDTSPFSEFQSPVTSRSVRTSQSLGSSQTSIGKKIKSIDKDPRAAKRSTYNNQISKFREEYEAQHDSQDEDRSQKSAQVEVYKKRIFSCMVISPAGRTIKGFQSIKGCLTGHRSLFEKANILDRASQGTISLSPILKGPMVSQAC